MSIHRAIAAMKQYRWLSKSAVAIAMTVGFASGAQALTLNAVVDAGKTQFTVLFNGFYGSDTSNVQAGLTSKANFVLDSVSDGGKTWTFTVNVTNTSTSPITDSRVSVLGFNTDPDVVLGTSGSEVSGAFDVVGSGKLLPSTAVDLCIKDGGGDNNCSGGGGGGISIGQTGTSKLTLVFLNAVADLELTDFAVRYQSIVGGTEGSARGFAINTPTLDPVPLPAAAWLFISALAGLAMIGRRRRMHAAAA